MNYNDKPLFKMIVAGGRDFVNYSEAEKYIWLAIKNKIKTHRVQIVSGRAKGADTMGEVFVTKFNKDNENVNISLKTFEAKWNDLSVERVKIKESKYGRKYNALAGMNRNEEMGDYTDAALIFWDGSSSGTANMISIMKRLKKPLIVWIYNPNTKRVLYQYKN